MLAWEPNRVAIIVVAIVVLAVAGTQLPALARVLTERYYRRVDRRTPRPAATDLEREDSERRQAERPPAGDGESQQDEGDEGPSPMHQSG
jgi:hypothetical protein